MSADTIVPGYTNPQSLNRYSYVSNNPLRYTDPTGHSQCQTHDDCEDMGTTPMGTGISNQNGGNGGHHDDDDDNVPHTQSLLNPTDANEGINEFHCFNHPYDCGNGPSIQVPSSQPNPKGPNWKHIAEGVGILLVVDLLIVTPIVAGIILTSPEVEILMVIDLPWEAALATSVVAVNVKAGNLVWDGIHGK